MIKLFTVALVAGLVFESHIQPAFTSSLGGNWLFFPTNYLKKTYRGRGCWTKWFDRDDPSVTGDWEVLPRLRKENPGKICRKPLRIQAKTRSGLSVAAAKEVIFKYDTTTGFVCRKQDQPDKRCYDYRVRFSCPPNFCRRRRVCWTDWFDRDDPSGSGDWETLRGLKKQCRKICKTPLYIQAVTTDTLTPAIRTGQVFYRNSPTQGFVCRNKDQKNCYCRDYKVRFGCPCGW